jgi:hypothetical protein
MSRVERRSIDKPPDTYASNVPFVLIFFSGIERKNSVVKTDHPRIYYALPSAECLTVTRLPLLSLLRAPFGELATSRRLQAVCLLRPS